MRAADLMAKSLSQQGADRIFCVPGESYLSLLDALHDTEISVVACRHEGGAGFMAVADAKLTGKPGVVAVSRGPGATNASIGVHLAQQDAVPLVLIIGQVSREERGRGAFQEVDYEQFFGGMAKKVWEVERSEQLSEVVARAFHDSQSGTPGPVVVVLQEDMLADDLPEEIWPKMPVARPGVDLEAVEQAAALLAKAKRPLIMAGGGLDSDAGRAALEALAKKHNIPVALTFRHQEIFDNSLPHFAGHLGFKIPKPHVELLKKHDLLLAIGTRLSDTPTQGYQLPTAPEPQAPLIHVYQDASPIGRVFRTELPVVSDPSAFCYALAARDAVSSADRMAWMEEIAEFMSTVKNYAVRNFDDGLDFGAVMLEIAKRAPADSIISEDAGNFSSWVHRIWSFSGKQKTLGAVGGAMGLGVPGAVAAGLRYPGKTILAFAGDGGLMMTGNELATAMACQLDIKIIVSNNGSYGTIRLHQERDHPHRITATQLVNPDFAAWAESFGAKGFCVGLGDDIANIVSAFLDHDGPALLDVRSSVEAISAFTTVEALRGGR